MMYYVTTSEYVGPNKTNSMGSPMGDTLIAQIQTAPGTTNSSNEERTNGWLGTTNDISHNAYGEFETLEEARAKIHDMGYTSARELDEDEACDDEIIETWISENAAYGQWTAGEFFDGIGREGACDEYGITAKTTDEEITKMVEKAEAEANDNEIELHECQEYFEELREELQEKAEED